MAYLVISFDKQEVDRRDLAGPVVIGRAADCDVAIKDIMLSRRHCRIEPGPQGWRAIDLDSRNGTTLNGDALTEARTLNDGNMLRLGRVTVRFQRGCLAHADLDPVRSMPRPADPNESLAGTLAGFTLLEPGEGKTQSPEHLPLPRPEPRTPAAYDRDDVYSLLSTIASSSWDSIYAQAKQPLIKQAPGAKVDDRAPRSRPRSPIDLSLQVVQTREQPAAPGKADVIPAPAKQLGQRGPAAPTTATASNNNLFPRISDRGMIDNVLAEKPKEPSRVLQQRLPAAVILVWASAIAVLAIKNSTAPLHRVLAPRASLANRVDTSSAQLGNPRVNAELAVTASSTASPVAKHPALSQQLLLNTCIESFPPIAVSLLPLIP